MTTLVEQWLEEGRQEGLREGIRLGFAERFELGDPTVTTLGAQIDAVQEPEVLRAVLRAILAGASLDEVRRLIE